MNNDLNKKIKNNKGFSLVEVLVAVTILAIITTPLIHTFVTAARTNAKAREVMRATTVAQNAMEDVKAYSVEELMRTVNGYDVDDKGQPAKLASLSSNTMYEAICTVDSNNRLSTFEKATKSETVGDAATSSMSAVMDVALGTITSSKFVGNADDDYFYVLEDVQLANNSYSYDVVTGITKASEVDVANILSMNQEGCAYFLEDTSVQNQATAVFNERYLIQLNGATATYTQSDFNDLMTKTVSVDITKNEMGKEYVTVYYTYSVDNRIVADNTYRTSTTTIFNNFVTNEDLTTVYIYYYPFYSTAGNRDSIEVTNSSGDDVTVYLISMARSSSFVVEDASTYRPRLIVYEDEAKTSQTADNTRLCSNLDDTKWNKLSTIVMNDLGNQEKMTLKYDVTIWVYKHDDAGFSLDDSKYVMKITGSTLDNQ